MRCIFWGRGRGRGHGRSRSRDLGWHGNLGRAMALWLGWGGTVLQVDVGTVQSRGVNRSMLGGGDLQLGRGGPRAAR